jgi:hypothetical protein
VPAGVFYHEIVSRSVDIDVKDNNPGGKIIVRHSVSFTTLRSDRPEVALLV